MESKNCDEDVDLYGDLPEFNMEASLHKLEAENKELTQKVKDLSCRVAELETQNTELNRMNKNLRANISALVKTVQKEIQRKDNTINELRQEREDLFFKRKKHYHQDTRTELNAVKNINQPIDDSENSGLRSKKDSSLSETATSQNHSSAETKILATFAKRRNGGVPPPIATTHADNTCEPQTDSCRNSTTERQSPLLISSMQKEHSDRPKTPTVYRLIPLPQSNDSKGVFQVKRPKSTLSRDQSSDPKIKVESDPPRKTSHEESGQGVVRISGGDSLIDPRIIRSVRANATVPEKENQEIPCGQTMDSPTSNEHGSQANSTSPTKRARKTKSTRQYVKTRSSARLSAKLSALETSNEDVSVLSALQLEQRIQDEFANSPMPEILSPIVSFQDNEKSLSPLRFPAGLGLSGPTQLPSSSVSGMSSLLEGALKNFNSEQHKPPLTECENSRLPVASDKLRTNVRREVFSSRERIPRQENVGGSVGGHAASELVTKPLSNHMGYPHKSVNGCLPEKGSWEASRKNQQCDEKEIHMKGEVTRTNKLPLKGIGRRMLNQEQASKVQVTRKDAKRNSSDSRKEVCAINEERLREEEAERCRVGHIKKETSANVATGCKEEFKKEGLRKKEDHSDLPRKEDPREPGTTRNEELRKKGAGRYEAPRKEPRTEEAARNEEPRKGRTTRNEESRKEENGVGVGNPKQEYRLHSGGLPNKGGNPGVPSNDNIEPPFTVKTEVQQIAQQKLINNFRKESPPVENGCPLLKSVVSQCSSSEGQGSDVTKRNFDSSALQCDFAVRRRTKVMLKIMVKSPIPTHNNMSEGDLVIKAPSKSPPRTAIDQTTSCVLSGSNHKDQGAPPQETLVEDNEVGKPPRDIPTASQDRSPRDYSKRGYNEAAHAATLKYVNDVKKRSRNECRRRSRSRPRFNKRENFPPVRPDHFHNRHPRSFRSPPRVHHSRRDDFRPHGFNFSRRSRSLSPQFAFRQRHLKKVERFCPAKLPTDKKEREMLLFGTSPARSPANHDSPSRPIVFKVNVRRKKNVQLEDEEVNKSPIPKRAGSSSSSQFVQTPIDFRERYAEIFSNTGESSGSESGAYSSETESSHSRDSDDSYRPKKKRKAGPCKKTKSKKLRKNDKEGL